ncbi:hypothetical protein APHAL10511_007927 [Amanita phalloides]|nr:hypothetical protein APHAL10511_007927 [Amanita phalloides]
MTRSSRGTYEGEQISSSELRNVGLYADREDDGLYKDADIYLSYGEEMEIREGTDAAAGEEGSQPHLDWKVAEAGWETFAPIQTLDQLYNGVLVCWQGLAINPQTFTPEQLLGVGRVV